MHHSYIFHYPKLFFAFFLHFEGPIFRFYHSMAIFEALFSEKDEV